MPTVNFHLWDNGQLRVLPATLDGPVAAGTEIILHTVYFENRAFHPVSCLPVPGSSRMYVYPATEEAVIDAALFQWRARPRAQHVPDVGHEVARYDIGYRHRLPLLPERLAKAASVDAWLTGEVLETFIALREGVVGFYPDFSPRRALLDRMIADIRALPERPKSIVEVGSGFGKFLLPLKQAFPDIHMCGIEPSAAGVAMTRQAAAHFGIDVELHQCTLEDAARTLTKQFDLAFTHSVVVQIPQPALQIVAQIGQLTKRWIHLYEHFTEMLGASRRDFMSLYYLTNIARYETGCLRHISSENGSWLQIRQATKLGCATNPFEEPSFVQLEITG